MRRLAALALLSMPAFCGDWNPRLAADFLDARQKDWFAWKVAAVPGGPCISCHTNLTYLVARPALRRALGEKQPISYETDLIAAVRTRAAQDPAANMFQGFTKEPGATQAASVT